MKSVEINILIIVLIFFKFTRSVNYNAFWEKIEGIPGKKETLADYSNMRVIRRGNNHYMNGTYTYKVDFDNTYKCELRTAYSATGSSLFINQPYEVKPTPSCGFFGKSYKQFGEPIFANKSNFPIVPENGLCPLPKNDYYVKQADLVHDNFPWELPRGLWKIELFYYSPKNELVGGLRLYMKFENK